MKGFAKYILLGLFISSIFFQSLKFSFLVYEYFNNNSAFTEKYCENKDKPELKCNGKCHLKKESTLNTSQENPISKDKKITTDTIEFLFYQEIKTYAFRTDFCFLNKFINSNYTNLYAHLITNSSFHPPQNLLFLA